VTLWKHLLKCWKTGSYLANTNYGIVELTYFQVLGTQSSGTDVKSLRDSEAAITRTYREAHQEVRYLLLLPSITGSDITYC
jgi:tmRNA-binding protein